MLQKVFTALLQQYTGNETLQQQYWQELSAAYTQTGRYYHTLQHLGFMLQQLEQVKNDISQWNAVTAALFYHDMVYDVMQQNNEETSAALAAKRLAKIEVPQEVIDQCTEHILTTKLHTVNSNTDTNLFTDADLSILGQPADIYKIYATQIRKEYAAYPDSLYNPGRAKVLQHFLAMPAIFKTTQFARYEIQAKTNIQQELDTLQA